MFAILMAVFDFKKHDKLYTQFNFIKDILLIIL